MTDWRGVGAELARLTEERDEARVRMYDEHLRVLSELWPRRAAEFEAIWEAQDEENVTLREERDEARAEVARLRARLAEIEDVAQVEEAGDREQPPQGVIAARVAAVLAELDEIAMHYTDPVRDGIGLAAARMASVVDAPYQPRSPRRETVEARQREAAEPSPERVWALLRHGPKRGGRG